MIIKSLDIMDEINKKLPLNIWRIERIIGSIVDLDCGEKQLVERPAGNSYFAGEITLSIDLCTWKFISTETNKILLTSEDYKNKKYDRVLNPLLNEKLLSLEEIVPRRKLHLNFSGGWRFILFENIKYYGYKSEMLWGFIDGQGWHYSPQDRFYRFIE